MYQTHNTLSLDLLQTDMEDFVEHFEYTMENRPEEIISDIKFAGIGMLDDVTYEPLLPTQVEDIQASRLALVDITRTIVGSTFRIYSVVVHEKLAFRLTVTRFRRDRLRLIFEEYFGAFRYARPFIEWLTPRWGEPVYLLNLDGTPMRRQPPTEIGLTSREMDVAEMIAAGVIDRKMAHELTLSTQEIKGYRRSISRKVKEYKQINRNLQPGELAQLLSQLGYGTSTIG